jgi:crossover junction endodeoxyribonuclease RuvC
MSRAATWRPRARLDLARRLHAIVHEVHAVIERYRPDQVVVESAFHHEFARSTLVLGHIRGALLVAAVEHDLPIAEYAPRAIKLAVTGRGGAGKEQVAAMVRMQLGLAETRAGRCRRRARRRAVSSAARASSTRRAS